MPTGPDGERRPADVTGCAVRVARILTGEETEQPAEDSLYQMLTTAHETVEAENVAEPGAQ